MCGGTDPFVFWEPAGDVKPGQQTSFRLVLLSSSDVPYINQHETMFFAGEESRDRSGKEKKMQVERGEEVETTADGFAKNPRRADRIPY